MWEGFIVVLMIAVFLILAFGVVFIPYVLISEYKDKERKRREQLRRQERERQLHREVRAADARMQRDYEATRQRMNERTGQSWRNLAG